MLKDKMRWLRISERLKDEIKQCHYEGKDVSSYVDEVAQILKLEEGPEKERRSREIYNKLAEAPIMAGYSYIEPETYEEISAVLPKQSEQSYPVDTNRLEDSVRGAWFGRSIGCLLGIPVETWQREDILNMLKESGQYPLTNYIRSDIEEGVKTKYHISDKDRNRSYDRKMVCWRNNVTSFPVDDDTNYTIAALRLIEEFGTEFTSDDVLETWMMSFPALHACTAERVAYQNALNMKFAPMSAAYLNPYREWIGAQIRGDFFGYISPGNPGKAAAMAYRDAAVSHTKNGIYGEMYIAALVSLAAVSKDALEVCRGALLHIPDKSRLFEDVSHVIDMYQRGVSYPDVIEAVHSKYNQKEWFDWCYVNPNTMIVTAGILFYSSDFGQCIINTVLAGFDTDCNGATVGSISGIMQGFKAIDKQWVEGLMPKLNSSIHGYYEISVEDAVKRTLRQIRGGENG